MLLKLISTIVKRFHFVFLLHQFRSRLSRPNDLYFHQEEISATFAGLEDLKFDPLLPETSTGCSVSLSLGKCVLIRPTLTCKQCYRFPNATQISDLEMNWTSSFLFQSDKLAIVPHLLPAPVEYRGEASRARICSSSKSASCGVAMLSAESWVEDKNESLQDKTLTLSSISVI